METIYKDEYNELILNDSFNYMKTLKDNSIDLIIADPPYFLSNDGFSNSGGHRVSVNKGNWDKSKNYREIESFYANLLKESYRILNPDGTIWIFGTMHNIYTVGHLLSLNEFKIINNITWQKSNPVPNLSRRMFTHSTETILWAKKKNGKHLFNYDKMRQINNNKQMKDVWTTPTISKKEKKFGNHPTQKPLSVLNRIIESSAKEGMTIFDPFSGSGTTAVAARIHKIKSISVDNSIDYCNIAKQRIQSFESESMGKIL